ncbi:MAG: dipeptide/oligopeptide/nickel ABC transporter permease/ATP-binding protein [Pyrinomonadaceae bacterium]|nr:dipeptide/oligopeptide/nickel ABC transporter permease/ATP-binding protein [Phycisphaerales bacterium]
MQTGVLRRLLARKTFMVGAIALVLIVLAAAAAPLITPYDPLKQDLTSGLLPPFWEARGSLEHPLGTDTLGRDLASRLLYGARNSLVIALFAVILSAVVGLGAGLLAGFAGGRWDSLIMRVGDMQLAFPFILLAIIVLGVIPDRNVFHLIFILGFPGWILYGRVVRSRVLTERDKDYVTAAKAIGADRRRQMWKYVLPSVWRVVLVIVMLDFGFIILVEATLSFLGFGLTPPTPSWGGILAEGRRNMIVAPWLSILPGLAIMFTVLAINLTADGAADVLDPRFKRGIFRRIRQQITPNGNAAAYSAIETSAASSDTHAPQFLEVRNLSVEFPLDGRVVKAVRQVSFKIDRGQTLGIVGESGSGKSVTASAIIQLIDPPGRVTHGEILFEGRDLTRISNDEMAQLRGTKIGMIFQNPTSSLNPVLSIGSQMVETIRQHRKVSSAEAKDMSRRALLDVGIGDPQGVMKRYPFQLSGGMNQRVMIALAMLSQPHLLIADEPTTALDVTTQAQILEQLREVIQEGDTALILITHDIALVREYADHVVVLYAGQVCESGPVEAVIHSPKHPYTQALVESVPRADLEPGERLAAIPGELPDAAETLIGCPFVPRCRYAMDVCSEINPPLKVVAPLRLAACHLNSVPVSKEAAT